MNLKGVGDVWAASSHNDHQNLPHQSTYMPTRRATTSMQAFSMTSLQQGPKSRRSKCESVPQLRKKLNCRQPKPTLATSTQHHFSQFDPHSFKQKNQYKKMKNKTLHLKIKIKTTTTTTGAHFHSCQTIPRLLQQPPPH